MTSPFIQQIADNRVCQVLTCLPEKFVVDFANGIDVAQEHIRTAGERTFFRRLKEGLTGEGAARQNAINASLAQGVEASLRWLTEMTTSLATTNYAITGPSDSRWQPGFLLCRTWSALTLHNHITPVFTFIFCLQRYPIMKIITRGEAMRIHQQHPTSRLFPFCTGKYRWHGSAEAYTGREVQDIPGVLAVFAERRKDSFGPYVRLMSVTLN